MARLPVRKSRSPRANAPAVSGGTVGTVAGLLALANGWPWYGALILVVVGLAAGIVPQAFTRPTSDDET